MYTYICKKCKDKWEFFLEDHDDLDDPNDLLCPLCSMPLIQMIKDVYEKEGIKGVLRQVYKRFF